MSKERYYIPALDGLRFFAFFLVFLHHRTPNQLDSLPLEWQPWWHGLIMGGAYGVSIFFALSSFLLTSILQKEHEQTGSIDIRSFYIRRALRIWPLYFLAVVVDIVVWPLVQGNPVQWDLFAWFGSFGANFKMLSRDGLSMPELVLWSICVEEQFYLVWPWLNQKLSPISLRICAWCMILAAVGFRLAAVGAGWWSTAVWFHTTSHLDCFGFGALAYLELGKLKSQPLERTLACLLPFGVAILIGQYVPLSGTDGRLDWPNALCYSLMAVAAAAGVWGVSQIKPRDSSFFNNKILRWLGRISFGLYVWHTLVIEVVAKIAPGLPWLPELVLRLAITIVVATITFYGFERPFLKRKEALQVVLSGQP